MDFNDKYIYNKKSVYICIERKKKQLKNDENKEIENRVEKKVYININIKKKMK